MGAYITRRLLWTLLLLWVVSGITFIVFNVLPSADPALLRAGRRAEPEVLKGIRETFGLDKPLYEQYWNYMKAVFLHGDFGRSYRNDVDVRSQIFDRLPNTLYLIAGAVIVWLAIGLTVGMISAVKRGSFLDRFSMTTPWWPSRRRSTGSAWSRCTSSRRTSGASRSSPARARSRRPTTSERRPSR